MIERNEWQKMQEQIPTLFKYTMQKWTAHWNFLSKHTQSIYRGENSTTGLGLELHHSFPFPSWAVRWVQVNVGIWRCQHSPPPAPLTVWPHCEKPFREFSAAVKQIHPFLKTWWFYSVRCCRLCPAKIFPFIHHVMVMFLALKEFSPLISCVTLATNGSLIKPAL